MTTSKQTDWMDHPEIRRLVERANSLTLAERITVVKGLIPGLAEALTSRQFQGFVADIQAKGERFHEAKTHPGQGRATRTTPGERDLERR